MSAAQITEATPEALDFVFDRLWARGQVELSILGIAPDVARARLLQEYEDGRPTMALWFGGEPVLVCGLMPSQREGGMATWFEATEDFGLYHMRITARMRTMLSVAAEQYDLRFIEVISACVHPLTGRWFAAMGLNIDHDYHQTAKGGERLYRFVRYFPKGA